MSAVEVIAEHSYARTNCDGCRQSYGYPERQAAHQLDELKAAGYAVSGPTPPPKRDACASCAVELEVVFEFEDARTPTKQYANALRIDLYGGYGMFFDDASHHVFLCHDCAHAACDALPWLSDLIQPHASHMHAEVPS